jgi:hypothetical protein
MAHLAVETSARAVAPFAVGYAKRIGGAPAREENNLRVRNPILEIAIACKIVGTAGRTIDQLG